MLFAAVNLGRFLKISPETALARGCQKFISRFEKMENDAIKAGKDLSCLSLDELDEYWNKAKENN